MELKFFLKIIFGFCILVIFGCSPSSGGGYAPTIENPSPNPSPSPSAENFKTSFTTGTATVHENGWVLDADMSGSIRHKTLSNGWKIEAQFE